MVLRSTKQYVTTLDRAAGAVRATKAYVSILSLDGGSVTLDASNALGISAGQLVSTVPPAAAENDFNFVAAATHNFIILSLSNSLSLSADTGQDFVGDIIQYIGWTPRTIVGCSNSIFSASTPTGPQQLLRGIVHDVLNDFNLTAAIVQAHGASNILIIAQSLQSLYVVGAFDQLSLTPAVNTGTTNFSQPGVQACLKQHLSFSIDGAKCIEKEYRPLVGAGGDPSYETVVTTPPVLTVGTLTLTYPFVSPSTTLVLKNPTFGNDSVFSRSAVHIVTRGGQHLVAADPTWPTIEVQNLTIENLCESIVDDLISFLNVSLGKKIGLLDWEGRQWSGVIVSPESEIVQTGIDQWRVTLAFDGVLA